MEGLFPKAGSSPGLAASGDSNTGLTPVAGGAKGGSSRIENLRKIPESDLVIQGLERLYQVSEEATEELAEKAKKKDQSGEKEEVGRGCHDSQCVAKSRHGHHQELQPVCPDRCRKEEKQAEADKKTPMEQFQENKLQFIGIGVLLLIVIVIVLLTNGLLGE